MDLATSLLNPWVGAYLLIVASVVTLTPWIGRRRRKRIAARRRAQGLPDAVLLNHAERLADERRDAFLAGALLLAAVVLTPLVLYGLADEGTARQGLALAFAALLVWLLVSGTDVARAALGGLAFRTLVAFSRPFQVGDRVTLRGVSGKVVSIDSFLVKLQTLNDDLVSIPTASLWGEVLTSANAGERASLCEMRFYLHPTVDRQARRAAEDVIWDAIQSSCYFEPSKPMQIYQQQNPGAIQLTARAYVASTYDEALFVSDVSQAFLDFAAEQGIPLALPGMR
jgi:hypothetical protein